MHPLQNIGVEHFRSHADVEPKLARQFSHDLTCHTADGDAPQMVIHHRW